MTKRPIRWYTQEEYDAELKHRSVNATMQRLDRLSGKVAVGFFVWGAVYLTLWIAAIVYFFL